MEKKQKRSHDDDIAKAKIIPTEIITGIFSWLLAKSIFRFRCVAESCSALTRNHDFVGLHQTRSAMRTNLLLSYDHDDAWKSNIFITGNLNYSERVTPRKVLEYQGFFRVKSCNGLISIHPHCSEARSIYKNTMIFNPSTRQTRSFLFNVDSFKDFSIMTNHLGFDPVSKQYKLMLVGTRSYYRDLGYCEIITLGSNNDNWRRVVTDDLTLAPDGGSSTCLNGALHWLLCGDYKNNQQSILVFDLSSEKFRTIPVPEGLHGDLYSNYICQVFGCLTLAEPKAESVLNLWMLKGRVWVQELIVHSIRRIYVQVVGNINNDEILIKYLSRMVCYHMKTKQYRKIDAGKFAHFRFNVALYTENMINLLEFGCDVN